MDFYRNLHKLKLSSINRTCAFQSDEVFQAHTAEGVSTFGVVRFDKWLQANITKQIVIHFLELIKLPVTWLKEKLKQWSKVSNQAKTISFLKTLVIKVKKNRLSIFVTYFFIVIFVVFRNTVSLAACSAQEIDKIKRTFFFQLCSTRRGNWIIRWWRYVCPQSVVFLGFWFIT